MVMKKLSGKTLCAGIACGKLFILNDDKREIKKGHIENCRDEIQRIKDALEKTKEDLQSLYKKATLEVGKKGAEIFKSYQVILEDKEYVDAVFAMIEEERVNAEFAVLYVGSGFLEKFLKMQDDYMRARGSDLKAVFNRLLENLSGENKRDLLLRAEGILVAGDLTAQELLLLDRKKIGALVTVQGSAYSHTAILASMLEIPYLLCRELDVSLLQNGQVGIVDAYEGTFIIDPKDIIIEESRKKIEEKKRRKDLFLGMKGKETVTKRGKKISLYANISHPSDISYVLQNDAEGIGLFRSEFLYLERDDFPSEEEQFQTYKKILQTMGSKEVVIRTIDLGADKMPSYLPIVNEVNPALGCRGIRFCLKYPQILKTQLKALFRAAPVGNLSIMYPMISSIEEVKEIYRLVKEVKEELDCLHIPYKFPKQGLMIETPAAVMISRELAEIADFFSIGSNDLQQYSLAIDRQSKESINLYKRDNTAIFRMIKMVVESAHLLGKKVALCGELAGDIEFSEILIELGLDELSVSPSLILPLREKIRSIE